MKKNINEDAVARKRSPKNTKPVLKKHESPNNLEKRRCKKCSKKLDLDEFQVFKDKILHICQKCYVADKKCTKCRDTLPHTAFKIRITGTHQSICYECEKKMKRKPIFTVNNKKFTELKDFYDLDDKTLFNKLVNEEYKRLFGKDW